MENEVNNLESEELELLQYLSHLECISDGVYPFLDYVMDGDIEEVIIED